MEDLKQPSNLERLTSFVHEAKKVAKKYKIEYNTIVVNKKYGKKFLKTIESKATPIIQCSVHFEGLKVMFEDIGEDYIKFTNTEGEQFINWDMFPIELDYETKIFLKLIEDDYNIIYRLDEENFEIRDEFNVEHNDFKISVLHFKIDLSELEIGKKYYISDLLGDDN